MREDVPKQPLRPLSLPREVGVRLLERGKRGIPFHEPVMRLGVNSDPGDQFDGVRQLHEVVGRPARQQFGLLFRFRHGGEHDHRDLGRDGQIVEPPHHVQPVDVGHDEILQDHGRAKRLGGGERRSSVLPKLQHDVVGPGQQPGDSLPDQGLVVDEKDTVPGDGHERA